MPLGPVTVTSPREDGEAKVLVRLRPRDAASLVIVDDADPEHPRLLLGRRAASHVFMAGKYVFPGGRIDAADLRLARHFGLPTETRARLLSATGARFGDRRAVALVLAALRETFEEVGAMLGTVVGAASPDIAPLMKAGGVWRDFAAAGVRPDTMRLIPFARALTPPGPPRRYDTRFFCAPLSATAISLGFDRRPDNEFDTVGWYALDEVAVLDLPGITRQVLGDFERRLRDGSWRHSSPSMPFYHTRHGRFVRDLI